MRKIKILALVFATAMLLSVFLPSAFADTTDIQETKTTNVYRGTIKVDGVIDELWTHAESVEFVYDRQGSNRHNLADKFDYGSNPKHWAKALWDDNYFYVLYYVYDTNIQCDPEKQLVHNRDGVEFYIDEYNDKETAKSMCTAMFHMIIPADGMNISYDSTETKVAVSMVDDGYIVELAYPFLVLQPKEGNIIGYDVSINCNDDGEDERDFCLAWNDRTNEAYISPIFMGNAKLCGEVAIDDDVTSILLRAGASKIKYMAPREADKFVPLAAATRYEVCRALANVFSIRTKNPPMELADVTEENKELVDLFTSAGIINGYTSDSTFRGEKTISRAEFCKIVCVMLDIDTENAKDANFNDTKDHWGKNYIDACANAGYVNGKGEGRFDPDGEIKRSEIATLINRITGAKAGKTCAYADVPSDAWYFGAVAAAAQ